VKKKAKRVTEALRGLKTKRERKSNQGEFGWSKVGLEGEEVEGSEAMVWGSWAWCHHVKLQSSLDTTFRGICKRGAGSQEKGMWGVCLGIF